MSQDPTNKIIIDEVGSGEGDELLGCYFRYDASNDTYNFFEENNDRPLKTHLQRGEQFYFKLSHHPNIEWRLSISKKSTTTLVKGKFKPKHHGADVWEPEQSYQAQAGVSADDDMNAAAATAS